MSPRVRTRVLMSLTAAMSVLTVGAITGPTAQASTNDIVIAVEGPLTGPQAAFGRDLVRGVTLAVSQVNAAGGVLGRRVRIVPVDDQANPDLAAAAVKKAKAAGAVGVIGPFNSSVGLINLPLYAKAGIVSVHMIGSNAVDGLGLTVQPKNSQVSPVESAYVESTGAKKVSMMVDPSAFTLGMANRLSSTLTTDGVAVTSFPVIESDAAANAAQATQALAGNPDLVYVSTYLPDGEGIAAQLATSTQTFTCLMGLANIDSSFVSSVGLAAAQRCAFSGLPEAAQLPGAKAQVFVSQFRKAFHAKAGVWSPVTYDSTKLLLGGIAATGTTDYGSVLSQLRHTTGYQGVTGKITINPKTGNNEAVKVYILKVNDAGAFVPIG